MPNGVTGVMITGPDNIVGGTAASNRNVISGSTDDGVRIGNVGRNKIEGNYIGTSLNGT